MQHKEAHANLKEKDETLTASRRAVAECVSLVERYAIVSSCSSVIMKSKWVARPLANLYSLT